MEYTREDNIMIIKMCSSSGIVNRDGAISLARAKAYYKSGFLVRAFIRSTDRSANGDGGGSRRDGGGVAGESFL